MISGYQDFGADIAFALQSQLGINVLTPYDWPDPSDQTRWCFPDTEEGILRALEKGATRLWANTVLFTSHPLQNLKVIGEYQDTRVVGQPPRKVEAFDDREFVYNDLRQPQVPLYAFTMPRGWTISEYKFPEQLAMIRHYPVVAKPIRGRGS